MSPSTIQQSIEALYQEAEALVVEGGPMLAVVQSTPIDNMSGQSIKPALTENTSNSTKPTTEPVDLKEIASLHAEARSRPHDDDDLPLKQRIQKLVQEAEGDWAIEDQDTRPERRPEHKPENKPEINNMETAETADLEAQVREDVNAVMADIAAAVGAVPSFADAKDAPTENDDKALADDQIDRASLESFISETVKTVLREELPKTVRAALLDHASLGKENTAQTAAKAPSGKAPSGKAPSGKAPAGKAQAAKAQASKAKPKTAKPKTKPKTKPTAKKAAKRKSARPS